MNNCLCLCIPTQNDSITQAQQNIFVLFLCERACAVVYVFVFGGILLHLINNLQINALQMQNGELSITHTRTEKHPIAISIELK